MPVCPYCEAFEGSESAVRAHISSKIDGDHKGHSGFGVEFDTEQYNCGECGVGVEVGQNYCHGCGEPLDWAEVTS